MSQIGETAVDACFQAFGVDALYFPPDGGGSSVPIRVLPRRGDNVLDFGETQIAVDSLFFEIKVADLADPAEEGIIQIDGTDYIIQAEPRIEDIDAIVWIIDTRKSS
ncbi:MAG: hypothetical protein H6863_03905 [Rhodospirillales bacterium]|nr:hypothetical protein [Rhodospirillales bacterium]